MRSSSVATFGSNVVPFALIMALTVIVVISSNYFTFNPSTRRLPFLIVSLPLKVVKPVLAA